MLGFPAHSFEYMHKFLACLRMDYIWKDTKETTEHWLVLTFFTKACVTYSKSDELFQRKGTSPCPVSPVWRSSGFGCGSSEGLVPPDAPVQHSLPELL